MPRTYPQLVNSKFMIKNSKTKVVEYPIVMNKSDKPEKTIFHFSGSGEFYPLAIEATSLPEAQKIYRKKRVPYENK